MGSLFFNGQLSPMIKEIDMYKIVFGSGKYREQPEEYFFPSLEEATKWLEEREIEWVYDERLLARVWRDETPRTDHAPKGQGCLLCYNDMFTFLLD